MSNDSASLSADRPLSNPAQDQFGHAPFAQTLAKAIRGYRGSDGIVLALYGPWGSGKSTVLAYVQHQLEHGPQDGRPVVVQFNPWWFSGQENLAKAFLGQLQAVLPSKFAGFKVLGNKLGEYSGALGRAVDLAGAAVGVSGGSIAVEALAKLVPIPPKDVPALKEALSALLLEQKKRILVVIDDIDRLAPDEMRQLFTVIKALADFPYVIYLLAFDREVASEAIGKQTGLAGDRFLEKIVQVPFDMPFVDRTTLHEALFKRLEEITFDGTPDGGFDKNRWADIFFFGGLDKLFRVPRDIVRLTNALSITYPAVVGEVNPVDFIAIECLRVFLPPVYHAMRDAPEQFVGRTVPDDFPGKTAAQKFHDGWLEKVPDGLRDSIRELVHRLFPRVGAIYSISHLAVELSLTWRRELRVCSADMFPRYFRLSLPFSAISRAEMDALFELANDDVALGKALLHVAWHHGPSGGSIAVALLDQMMDLVPSELDEVLAAPVIIALFEMGDGLLERVRGSSGIAFGNESRIRHIAYHLLKKVSPTERLPLLIRAIERGRALRCSQCLIAGLSDEAEKAEKGEGKALLGVQDVALVQKVWLNRIVEMSAEVAFEDHPRLALLLRGWRHLGDPAAEAQARAWWQATSAKDEGLLKLIAAYATQSTLQYGYDHAVSIQLRVNPKLIQPYADVQALAIRVQGLLDAGRVTEDHQPSAKRFVLECARMREGQDPDADDFDDDDE